MALSDYAARGPYRRMPGTSWKSAWFSVQSRAPRTRAHAAIAKSTSRVGAFLTARYRSALTMASSVSNGIADFDGNRRSCAASSSDNRGDADPVLVLSGGVGGRIMAEQVLDGKVLKEMRYAFPQVEVGIVAHGVEQLPEGVGIVAGHRSEEHRVGK